MTAEEIHRFVISQVIAQLEAQGRTVSEADLSDDKDLLMTGLIDSLGLLELTAALEEYCGFELDFEGLDPEQMTVIGPLCEFVAREVAARLA